MSFPTVRQSGNITPGHLVQWITDGVVADGNISSSLIFTVFDAFEFVIDGTGLAVTSGFKGVLQAPYYGTISQATLLADQTGTIVVNVYKCTQLQYDGGVTHPTVGDKITSSTPPTITGSTKSQDNTLSGWTTIFNAGDIFGFNVDSTSGVIQRVLISLRVTRS